MFATLRRLTEIVIPTIVGGNWRERIMNIQEKINTLQAQRDDLESQRTQLALALVDASDTEYSSIQKKLDTVKERLRKLDSQIDDMHAALTEAQARMSIEDQKAADTAEKERLTRIQALGDRHRELATAVDIKIIELGKLLDEMQTCENEAGELAGHKVQAFMVEKRHNALWHSGFHSLKPPTQNMQGERIQFDSHIPTGSELLVIERNTRH